MSLLYHNLLKMATLIDVAYIDWELSPEFRRRRVNRAICSGSAQASEFSIEDNQHRQGGAGEAHKGRGFVFWRFSDL